MGLNLTSTISLNSAEFERGLDRVKEQVADSIKAFALGAIGIGTVEEAFRRTIETADQLVNSAKNLDMTVEQVQLLKQAATNAGIEFDTLAKSISKIDEARAKALGGDRKSIAAFQAVGITHQDLMTKTATDLFTGKLSDAAKNNNIETITQPMREILGRGAEQAISTLKTNFTELQDTMVKTGAIMDTETAVKLHVLSDNFSLLSRIVMAQLAPALAKLAEWALRVTVGTVGKLAGGISILNEGRKESGLGASLKDAGATLGQAFLNVIQGKPMKLTPEQQSTIDKKYGINTEKVTKAIQDAEKPYNDLLANVDKQVADQTNSLKSPKPDFSKTATDARRANEGNRKASDSLISVGNYLGRNSSAISGVQYAQQTATNTKRIADSVEKLSAILKNVDTFIAREKRDEWQWPNP
jgi:hypothetical protein